jgi:hypothetical protein
MQRTATDTEPGRMLEGLRCEGMRRELMRRPRDRTDMEIPDGDLSAEATLRADR